MELLNLVDERLRPLAVADENALLVVLEEVAAAPRPEGVAPEVEPRAVLASRLVSIETECRMLRDSLHVELTFASRAEWKNISAVDPASPSLASESSLEPEDSTEPEENPNP